nr:unnamed protein product [Spirometra erinaceieuropaei]
MQTLHKPSQTETTPPVADLCLVSTGQQTPVSTVSTLATWCLELLSRGVISLPRRDTALPSLRGRLAAASYPSFFSKSDLSLLVQQLPRSGLFQMEAALGLWDSEYLRNFRFQRRPLLSLPAVEIPSEMGCSDSGTYLHKDSPLRVEVGQIAAEEVPNLITAEGDVNSSVRRGEILSEPVCDLGVIPSPNSSVPMHLWESVSVCFQKPSKTFASVESSAALQAASDRLLGEVPLTESYSVSQDALDSDGFSPSDDLVSSSDLSLKGQPSKMWSSPKLQSHVETVLEEVQSLVSAGEEDSGQSEAAKRLLRCLEELRKEMGVTLQTTAAPDGVPLPGDRGCLLLRAPPDDLRLAVDSQIADLCIGEVWSSLALRLEQRYRRWSMQSRDELLFYRDRSNLIEFEQETTPWLKYLTADVVNGDLRAQRRIKFVDMETLGQCFREFQSFATDLHVLTECFSNPNDGGLKDPATQPMRLIHLDLCLLRCTEGIARWFHIFDSSTATSPNKPSSKIVQLFRQMVNFQLASSRPADPRPDSTQAISQPSLHAANKVLEATRSSFVEERARALKSCFACLTLLRSHLTRNSFAWRTRFARWQTILREAQTMFASESASLRTAMETRDIKVAISKVASMVSHLFRGPDMEAVRTGVRYLLPISSQHDKFLDDVAVFNEDISLLLRQTVKDLLNSTSFGEEEENSMLTSHLERTLQFAEASLTKLPSGVVQGSPISAIETIENLLRHATKMAHLVLLSGSCAADHQRVSDRYSEFFRRVSARLREELAQKWQISDLQNCLAALEAVIDALAQKHPLLARLPRITLDGLQPRTYDLPALTLGSGTETSPPLDTLEIFLARGEDVLTRLARISGCGQSNSDDLDHYKRLRRHLLLSVRNLRSQAARAVRAQECLREVTTQLVHWLDESETTFHAVRSALVSDNPSTSAADAVEDIDQLNEHLGRLDDIFAELYVVQSYVISKQLPHFTAACLSDDQTMQLVELATTTAARFQRLRLSITEAVSQGHHLLLQCVRGDREIGRSERPAFLRRYRHTLGCLRDWLFGALRHQQDRSQHCGRPRSPHDLLSFCARLATRWSLFTQLSQLLVADAVNASPTPLPQHDDSSTMEQLRLESDELLEFWSQCMRVTDANVALLEAVEVGCDQLDEDLDEVEVEAAELEAWAAQMRVFSRDSGATISKVLQRLKEHHQFQVDRLQAIQSRLSSLAQTPAGYLDWPELPAELQTRFVKTPSGIRDPCPLLSTSSVEGLQSRIADLAERYQRLLPSFFDEAQCGAFTFAESSETKIADLEAAAISAENFLSILQRCANNPSGERRSTQADILFLDCALQAQLGIMQELREKHAIVLSCIQTLENSVNDDSFGPSLKGLLETTIARLKDRFLSSIKVMDKCCSVDFGASVNRDDHALESADPVHPMSRGTRSSSSSTLSALAARFASETDLPSVRSHLFTLLSNLEAALPTDDYHSLGRQGTHLNRFDADDFHPPPPPPGRSERLEESLDSFVRFYSGLSADHRIPEEVVHVPILLLRLRELERVAQPGPFPTEDPSRVSMSLPDRQSGTSCTTACGYLAGLCSTAIFLPGQSQDDSAIGKALDAVVEFLRDSVNDGAVGSQGHLSSHLKHFLDAQLLDVLNRLLGCLLLLGNLDLQRASGCRQTFLLNLIKTATKMIAQVEASADLRRRQQNVETAARAERELHVILLGMETVSMGQRSGNKRRSLRSSLELLTVLLFNDGHLRKLLAESSSRAEQETRVLGLYAQLTQALVYDEVGETRQAFADLYTASGKLLSVVQCLPSPRNLKLSADYMAAVAAAVDKISVSLESVRLLQPSSNPECSSTDVIRAVAEAEVLVYSGLGDCLSNFVAFSGKALQPPSSPRSPTRLIEAFRQSLTSVLSLLDKTSVSEDGLDSVAPSDEYLEQFSMLSNSQVLSESEVCVRDAALVLGTVIELDLAFIEALLANLEAYCHQGACTREKFRADFAAAKIALSESQRELERTAAGIRELRQQYRDLKLRIFYLCRRLMIPPTLALPESLKAQGAPSQILAFREELSGLTMELHNFAEKLGLRSGTASPDNLPMLLASDRERSCQSLCALRLMLQSCAEFVEIWNDVPSSSVQARMRFASRSPLEYANPSQQLSDKESPPALVSIPAPKRPQEVSRLNLGGEDWSLQQAGPSEATSINSEVNRLRRKIMGWLVPSLDENGGVYARLSKDASHRLTESLRDVDLIDEAYASNSITARSPVYPMNALRRIDAECQAIVSGRQSQKHAAAASARSRSLQALIRSSTGQYTEGERSQDLRHADVSPISDCVRSREYYASVPNLCQAASSSRYSVTSGSERRLLPIAGELLSPGKRRASDVGPVSRGYHRNLVASTEPSEGESGRLDASVQSRRPNWVTEANASARSEVSQLQSHSLSSLRELRDRCVRFLAFSHSVESYLSPSQTHPGLPPIVDTDLVALEQTTQRWLELLVTHLNSSAELRREISVWKAEMTGTSSQNEQRLISSISWWHDVLQTISGLNQRVQPPGHPSLGPLADLVGQIESIGVRAPGERPPYGAEVLPSLRLPRDCDTSDVSDPPASETPAGDSREACENLARRGTHYPIGGVAWCQRQTNEDAVCTSLSGPADIWLRSADAEAHPSSYATPIDSEVDQQSFRSLEPSRGSTFFRRHHSPSRSYRGWCLLAVLGLLFGAYFCRYVVRHLPDWPFSRTDCLLNYFELTLSLPGLTIENLETLFSDLATGGQPPV